MVDFQQDYRNLRENLERRAEAFLLGIEGQGDTLIAVTTPGQVLAFMGLLRDDAAFRFKQLVDIAGVDYPGREKRFEVVYQLLSFKHNLRLTVKLSVAEDEPVPSVINIFPSAGWYEREAWDMYGIFFTGHPDLRRILSDYGFSGHAQRKDFPLTGHVEVRYDPEKKRVVYEPVKLTQEFRNFDYMSPWDGPDYVLPGDEKAEKAA